MGSAEMLCVVCETAPKAGFLFPISEELYRELLQTFVPQLGNKHNISTGKRHHRKYLPGFCEVCVDSCCAPILRGVELFEVWAILLHRTVAGRVPGRM